jgi:hypothetical protein
MPPKLQPLRINIGEGGITGALKTEYQEKVEEVEQQLLQKPKYWTNAQAVKVSHQ